MNGTIWVIIAAICWLGLLLLPWRPWATREVLDAACQHPQEENLGGVTVLIPARNEADMIAVTLRGLHLQGPDLSVVLIDDQSTDDTVRVARRESPQNLRIIPGTPPPPGWSGKLWALQQGLDRVDTPMTLLLDADIELCPGVVSTLLKLMRENGLPFISLMAALRMSSFWERLLMPAFIYFFKILYPFSLSNSSHSGVAAAAGGCILLETRLLHDIDGFLSVCGELIDDCALARRIKSNGHRTWIGLTRCVRSQRTYERPSAIWNMVARTAFNQLHYSTFLLILVTVAMLTLFLSPVAGLFLPGPAAKLLSAGTLGAMMFSYLPTLRFYGLSRIWAAGLPLTGLLYLAMTWTSALRFWRGQGPTWKDRSYKR